MGSGPKGAMFCRMQGIFCPSVRPSIRSSIRPYVHTSIPPRPRPPGQGLLAQAPRPRPPGPGLPAQAPRPRPPGPGPPAQASRPRPPSPGLPAQALAQAPRPRPPGLGLTGPNLVKAGQMDGQNIPCILQNIAPLGPLPCSQSIAHQKTSGPQTIYGQR